MVSVPGNGRCRPAGKETPVAVIREGAGPEVLLVHGGASPARTWSGLEYLSKRWTLVYVYRRGFDPSPGDAQIPTLVASGDHHLALELMCDALAIAVGHSEQRRRARDTSLPLRQDSQTDSSGSSSRRIEDRTVALAI